MHLYGNGSHALISFILNKIEEVCFKTYMKNSKTISTSGSVQTEPSHADFKVPMNVYE